MPLEDGLRPDWTRLLRSASREAAVDEIGRWPWSERAELALTADDVLDAWRRARDEITRAEAGLAARSRELDLLQRAAEAVWAEDLFAATAAVLHQGRGLDLVLAGYELDGALRVEAFLARPVTDDCLRWLARRAARFLGRTDEPEAVERRETEEFDGQRTLRRRVDEEELVLLPVVRRGQPVACLVAVSAGPADDGLLRVFYSASNQLSLHLDRILTVREAEADRFRSIVDSMPQGVLLADGRLRLLLANRAARKLLAAAGLVARGDLTALVRRLGIEPLVERVRRERAPVAEGDAHVDTERVFSVTVSPVRDERGSPSGTVLVLTDVSERRRLERQLARSEKMSSLGRMISGVAHELNNPLTSIVGYAQLVAAQGRDPLLAERLGILRREAERCRRIVENLLSFARPSELQIRAVSLNDVARETIALLDYQLRVDRIAVVAELDREVPAVRGDAHQLGQVLVNLVTNARHAIRGQGGPGGIVIRTARAEAGRVLLEVRDSGPGVPLAIRARIFDPFFTTKAADAGTGLGLWLVYGIVSAHGGTVEVQPAAEGGAAFRILLEADAGARAVAGEGAATPGPGQPARASRILVVDDEEPLARLICEVLTQDGHRAEAVFDGPTALARAAEGGFDLIISDVRMPGMDGDQLGHELERIAPGLARRLLLTTGDTLSEPPREPGAHDVLRKPFDLDELRRVVRARLQPAEA